MNRLALLFLFVMSGIASTGCSSLSSNEIHVGENDKPSSNPAKFKSLASVRIAGYVDGRNSGNHRKIGMSTERIFGLSGMDIILDRDVTEVVSDSIQKRMEEAGILILSKEDNSALYELSGVIKELNYDVKVRDYVHIRLETTLKEVATGKVIWFGEVEQKDDRFAGVSGNNKSDIAAYLKQQLKIVTSKTTEAITSLLASTRPELFELTPGSKLIPGVKVFVTPNSVTSKSPVVAPPTPTTQVQTQGPSTNGVLVVNTEPVRAKVYLDGVYFGLTPLRAETAPGIHKVEVKKLGYKNAVEKVSIRYGDSTELDMTLEH